MGKLGVEQNGRTFGCDGVFFWGEKKKLGENQGGRFFWVIRESTESTKENWRRRSNPCEKVEKAQ